MQYVRLFAPLGLSAVGFEVYFSHVSVWMVTTLLMLDAFLVSLIWCGEMGNGQWDKQ